MTPPRARTAAPPDPLADLRPPEPTSPAALTPPPIQDAEPADGAEATLEVAAFDQAWHEDAITQVVKRWHADRTAERRLHKGGSCGCAYLARLALLEAVGVAQPDAEQEAPGADV